MKRADERPLVSTIKERCRCCYTCVRECPAKAIRVTEGQAEVLPERCIGCGNCVRVCSQHAKEVLSSTDDVSRLLAGESRVAACIAPSFPTEFYDYDYKELVGMIRSLGFDYVNEVGFGADLVADRYRKLIADDADGRYIATTCPAVVSFVERYHPNLVQSLAPIVSPMVAIARALRRLHGDDLKIVFIGPCIAKKGEALTTQVEDEVDAALTFIELREVFQRAAASPERVEPSEFDPPFSAYGTLFPISRGLLQAAEIREDLLAGDVVVADGREDFVDALKEFASGGLDARLLEVLACNGCIMGPGVSNNDPLFCRRSRVTQHVRDRLAEIDMKQWREDMARMADLDLSRVFAADDHRIPLPSHEDLARIMTAMGKFKLEDELNCGACGYDTCREHAVAIFKGLAESEMCLPYAIEQLRTTVQDLAVSNDELARTQEALMQSEKLASMGQLAAGIAHELNNPLGVVLMYAHLLRDEKGQEEELRDDLNLITEQADRCKKIVSGLLHFARQNKVTLEVTDVRTLVEQSLRTLSIPDSVRVDVRHDVDDPIISLDHDQIMQVLTNLMTNALGAMPEGGVLTVRSESDGERVRLSVGDTGTGIPKGNLSKVFEPFFTTKEIGKGTGLGLAVAYGIVKMHSGDIRVESNADPNAGPTGTTFTVTLPRRMEKTAGNGGKKP